MTAAHHDRQPGDAEAAGAIAAMRDDTWFRRGDIVRFTDPERGFHLEAARVVNALPGKQLVVETVAGEMEMVIAASQVIVWECA